MSTKSKITLTRTLIIVLTSVFAFAFVAMHIGISSVHAVTPPTIVRIENPSPQDYALFGRAVDGIGDVNDDGTGDLVVGAPGADLVYVLSGEDQTIIHTIVDPNGLSGYRFGYAVCGVGDLNDDGFEDIAVGAPGPSGASPVPCDPLTSECPPPEWGRVFVFSGENGDLILSLIPEDSDFWTFGSALASLGDVNGDGTPDIAVGCPVYLSTELGRVYAFSGADESQLWTTSEPESLAGEKQTIASFGAYLSEISDLTGDGCNDLLAGAPFFDCDPDTGVDLTAGRAYILSGADGTIFREHLNSVPTLGDFFGAGLCAIGDQDDDSIEDYCIGEPGVGILHLFSGASGTFIRQIVSPGDGSIDFFGFAIAKVDDKDRDGIEDFWVAAPKGGAVYLMNSMGVVLVEIIDGDPVPTETEGGFGWRIAATEDLNEDSGMDLIVGKPAEFIGGFDEAGAAYLILGAYANIPPVADAGPDITVSADENCLAQISLDGSGSNDPDGDPLTYEWIWTEGSASGVNPNVILPLGVTTITLTVNDGLDSDTDTVVITVVDTTPPDITCPPDITAEQTSADGTPVDLGNPTVNDNCDDIPAISNDAPAVFPLGETSVTWTATDFSGNSSSCTQVVTVVDTTPPDIQNVSASPNKLWPPSHKMVPVTVTCVCEDICDIAPVCMIISVESNQPVNDTGDGNTEPDWEITGDLSVNLMSERAGNIKGDRIYTITVECTDFSGNSSAAIVEVIVPHDQGKKTVWNNPWNIINPLIYNNVTTPLPVIQKIVTMPLNQGTKILPSFTLNGNNFSANGNANSSSVPISVIINNGQGNKSAQSNPGNSNNSFKYNVPSLFNPFAQGFGIFSSFDPLKQLSFSLNGNMGTGYLMGNSWGWNSNYFKQQMNPAFGFSFMSQYRVPFNSSFNAFPFSIK